MKDRTETLETCTKKIEIAEYMCAKFSLDEMIEAKQHIIRKWMREKTPELAEVKNE